MHINFTYLFIFRERGREGEREGEEHQSVVYSHAPPTGDLACNPGMCPDWESSQQPFGSQAGTQSTDPHQPGFHINFKITFFKREGKGRIKSGRETSM